jgi:hypothetical protein
MYEARPNDAESGMDAVRTLVSSGPVLGWCLGLSGFSWGASRLVERVAAGPWTPSGLAAAFEGLAIATIAVVVARAVRVSCRLAASVIAARRERRDRSDEAIAELAGRAVAAFERLADVLERPLAAAPAPAALGVDRSRRLVQINRALDMGRREEAKSSIEDLELHFPDDPSLPDLRQRLDAARRQEQAGTLAQLEAARQVNDHTRVLELYRCLKFDTDVDRADLDRDLARWFLQLIQRRLWGRRIQPEVVELAATVAETFAATVEGASLRASLPTLRRSVGLCPRCAQPYTGTAEACPQCISGTTDTVEPDPTGLGPGMDDASSSEDGPDPSAEGRDAGWMFYDEDDTGDPSSPA